jgi:hypothetical protein
LGLRPIAAYPISWGVLSQPDKHFFCHYAVAGGVDDPPTVPADQRQNHTLMGLEVAHGGGLVRVHEPAVAGDVGGKNGGEPTARD